MTVSPTNDQPVYIYALCDPQSGYVRYIGQTTSPYWRQLQHRPDENDHTSRGQWLRELGDRGLFPRFVVLATVPSYLGLWAEVAFMRAARAGGADLLNTQEYAAAAEETAKDGMGLALSSMLPPRRTPITSRDGIAVDKFVWHPIFGGGIVLSQVADAVEPEIVVKFWDKEGQPLERRLVVGYARLKQCNTEDRARIAKWIAAEKVG